MELEEIETYAQGKEVTVIIESLLIKPAWGGWFGPESTICRYPTFSHPTLIV